MNDAENAVARHDRDADRRADAIVADGVAGLEPLVVHRVGGEDALAAFQGVANDRRLGIKQKGSEDDVTLFL